jgi:hypothetical protein
MRCALIALASLWSACGSDSHCTASYLPGYPSRCGCTGDPRQGCITNCFEETCTAVCVDGKWTYQCGPETCPPACVEDLAPRSGCRGYVACLNGCAASTSGCSNCGATTRTGSLKLFKDALLCGQSWCLGLNDLGSGDCVLDPTMVNLIDPPGRPGACGACLDNALAGLFGNSCIPSGAPDCNPPNCIAAYQACQNDGA